MKAVRRRLSKEAASRKSKVVAYLSEAVKIATDWGVTELFPPQPVLVKSGLNFDTVRDAMRYLREVRV